jgi:hypothetical protein
MSTPTHHGNPMPESTLLRILPLYNVHCAVCTLQLIYFIGELEEGRILKQAAAAAHNFQSCVKNGVKACLISQFWCAVPSESILFLLLCFCLWLIGYHKGRKFFFLDASVGLLVCYRCARIYWIT